MCHDKLIMMMMILVMHKQIVLKFPLDLQDFVCIQQITVSAWVLFKLMEMLVQSNVSKICNFWSQRENLWVGFSLDVADAASVAWTVVYECTCRAHNHKIKLVFSYVLQSNQTIWHASSAHEDVYHLTSDIH